MVMSRTNDYNRTKVASIQPRPSPPKIVAMLVSLTLTGFWRFAVLGNPNTKFDDLKILANLINHSIN